MASSSSIEGFDADAVRAGLRLAMTVGLPPVEADKPTFYMPRTQPTFTENVDSEGVPFDPDYRPPWSPPVTKKVSCAIEYVDGEGKMTGFGITAPTKVILTLLDVDYAQVKGFEYVVIGPTRYFYRRTETPKGLVSVGLFKVHCQSEDEG
ncbi:MAG TPA: hypothetical protein VNA32_10430 [Actinomycetota bacterium]|nr:hypothetical protein [Actinomycetota bacterium]